MILTSSNILGRTAINRSAGGYGTVVDSEGNSRSHEITLPSSRHGCGNADVERS